MTLAAAPRAGRAVADNLGRFGVLNDQERLAPTMDRHAFATI